MCLLRKHSNATARKLEDGTRLDLVGKTGWLLRLVGVAHALDERPVLCELLAFVVSECVLIRATGVEI